MEPRTARRTADHGLQLPPEAVEQMRAELPQVAEHVVAAIIDEVPSYTDAFSGPMGETIRNAVQLALAASSPWPAAGAAPTPARRPRPPSRAPTSSAAARPAAAARPRRCSRRTGSAPGCPGARCRRPPCDNGVDGETLVGFAELVFAYIDELSAASGRRPHRRARHHRPGPAAAAGAGRPPPARPASPVDQVRRGRRAGRVGAAEDADRGDRPGGAGAAGARLGLPRHPAGGRRPRARRGRAAAGAGRARPPPRRAAAHARRPRLRSPGRPGRGWRCARRTTGRCGPAPPGSSSTPRRTWSPLVLDADPAARADLRAAAARAARRPAPQHRREAHRHAALLAAAPGPARRRRGRRCSCTPQTVRYRMGQLRELYGDRLDDPETVLALTVALG